MPFSGRTRNHALSTRRRFLGACGLGLAVGAPAILASLNREITERLPYAVPTFQGERSLKLLNTNTGEGIEAVFWYDGAYQAEELGRIDRLLRDHHTGEIRPIDTALLEQLDAVQAQLEVREEIHITSAYRAPETNADLAGQSQLVSEHSFHLQGRALDFWIPGVTTHDLKRAARALEAGGVGFYPSQRFIHMDSGPVRFWQA